MTNSSSSHKEHQTTVFAQKIILAFSAIGTVFTLSWVMWYSYYGIDFTDESFYIVWMSNPFNYSISGSQFGFIYHPLYKLLSGNIALIRQVNALITFGLAWTLSNIFLKKVFQKQPIETKGRVIISAALATTSLMSLLSSGHWLPTPNYNSLAFQALLIAAIGLLLADKTFSWESITGWSLIGIGGWLSFMGKPTTAAALGLCSGFYLLATGKLRVRFLIFSLVIATSLLILSALTIDGSIVAFVDRHKGGMEAARLLGGGHTLARSLRLGSFKLSRSTRYILFAATTAIFFAAYFSQTKNKALVHVSTALSMAFGLSGLAIILGFTNKHLGTDQLQCLLLLAIPFAAVLTKLALYRFRGFFQISRFYWVLALVFLIFPHVYAFGTNRNYWDNGTNAAIFWLFSGLALLGSISPVKRLVALLIPFGLGAQLVTIWLIHTGIEAPQRQPQSLRENDYKLEIGAPGSTLLLSKDFGRYVAEVNDVAKQAGFMKGTPMLDLSGQSPGILYAIGAVNIGQAWMIGGYPGSATLANFMLSKVSCSELASSWLLMEPDGPRSITSDVLNGFGSNLTTDYKVSGSWMSAPRVGAWARSPEPQLQQLLKPIRPKHIAVASCEAARRGVFQ